ncbi:MAG TPA: DivIVA domain-containing protein [Acidimicrobiales bacterium]|jgi:cell division initiation protein|nr:DivIVA domain-containing protein [Acidimicrobiales bacterium]
MDNTTTTQSALDALRTAEFRLSLRGYDVDEVDDFLERAAVEADQLREQVRQASAQAASASERVRHQEPDRAAAPAPSAPPVATAGPGSTETVSKMLEMAERFVEQTRLDAETEAAAILADAQERARQLATDAQQRLADEVARLEGLRQRLGEDVEQISRKLETERTRLTGSLHDLLGWIDTNLQPVTALAPTAAPSTNGPGATGAPSGAPTATANGQATEPSAQVFSLDDARRDE